MVDTQRPVYAKSLRYIIEKLEAQKKLTPGVLRRYILEADVQPEDLEAWADFDHPIADSYGRKLVYKGDNFEIMVMSWRPGDFSTIHDHGYTQWGAVQIFGPAEHATFRLEDGHLSTLARWTVKPRDVVGVGHSLIHQMGNPTKDTFFLSLHIYGDVKEIENVTGDARTFDLQNGTIQRIDGGVFFALPEEEIKSTTPGIKADYPTRLRHMIELIRRLRKMKNAGIKRSENNLDAIIKDTFSTKHIPKLLDGLAENTNEKDHQINSLYWRSLNREMQEAAQLQNELKGTTPAADSFHKYAEMYDALICQPCLDGFMDKYLQFLKTKTDKHWSEYTLISLGAGTGLVEKHIIEEMGIPYEKLYGIDISEAMVNEARRRIQADVGDVLHLDPSIRLWDIAYSGLNVFHYLDFRRLEEAIQKTATIVKDGGYFIGDFITPDHIRWYPNVMYSADKKIISLRTPMLIENDGRIFQESEIINIDATGDQIAVNYAGKHRRFLPPMHRIRTYFENAFGGTVELYDAYSLQPIPAWADSCPSTRYVVFAQKR